MDPDALRDAGWTALGDQGFTGLVGPILSRGMGRDREFAFVAQPQHGNRNGVVHGGMLMTFADTGLGNTVVNALHGAHCATIQLQMQFAAPAHIGDLVICRTEIIRRSLTFVFVRGLLSVRDKTIASADGIWAVLAGKPRLRKADG
jgi:acyl-coenzyme A thioesterase PaaI-like protein